MGRGAGAGTALGRETSARVARWLSAARLGREQFTWVLDIEEIPAGVRADSSFWCDLVLQPEANPYSEGARARHAFHVATRGTLDLLRHEIGDIVIIEGRNFLLVEAPRACAETFALPPPARRGAVQRLAADLFRPALRIPAVISERSRFTIGRRADPRLLAGEADRVDGGVDCGNLYFLWYKKPGQRVGFLNGRQWFDDDFRRRVAAC